MAEYIDIDAPIDVAVYQRNRRIQVTLRQILESNDAKYERADVRPVEWIPVTERLPELDEQVLVCNEDYGLSRLGFATVAVWDGTDWIEAWDRIATICCVTHWMPLPEPPKEE